MCCCDVETVDSLNNAKIHPIISNLVQQNYFRYFKVGVALFKMDNSHFHYYTSII